MKITTKDISDDELEELFALLPCIDFRGRNTVEVREKSKRLRLSKYHICRLLPEDEVAIAQFGNKKSMIRTPLNEYRRWILVRLMRGTKLPLRDEGKDDNKVVGLLSRLRTPWPTTPKGERIVIPQGLIPPPGKDCLKVDDVADLTGQSPAGVALEMASANLLCADFSSRKASRSWMRIPRTIYLSYVAQGLATGLSYKPCPRQKKEDDLAGQIILFPDHEKSSSMA